MYQWSGSSLVQTRACCWSNTKPSPEIMFTYCRTQAVGYVIFYIVNWTHKDRLHWNFNSNSKACMKMSAILFIHVIALNTGWMSEIWTCDEEHCWFNPLINRRWGCKLVIYDIKDRYPGRLPSDECHKITLKVVVLEMACCCLFY